MSSYGQPPAGDRASAQPAQPREGEFHDEEETDDHVPELSGPPPRLPEPAFESTELSLDLILNPPSLTSNSSEQTTKVQKRASNVIKLAQENDKLAAELKAMSERLEAAERKQQELLARQAAQAERARSPRS